MCHVSSVKCKVSHVTFHWSCVMFHMSENEKFIANVCPKVRRNDLLVRCQVSHVRCQMSGVTCQVKCPLSPVRGQASCVTEKVKEIATFPPLVMCQCPVSGVRFRCPVSPVKCQVSGVICHVSYVMCHMSNVTVHVSQVMYSFFLSHKDPKVCQICHVCADYST